MKMHAKEIIKNKADKMVDLIIDEIGPEGEKKLSASFIDKKTNIKYMMQIKITSGSPDEIEEEIDEEDYSGEIRNILERLVALEIKEDADTVYDDSDLEQRVSILEDLRAHDTDDDAGIRARLALLEKKVFAEDNEEEP